MNTYELLDYYLLFFIHLSILNWSWFIIYSIILFLLYSFLLFLISLISSINLCSEAFASISNNFECGFYSIIISSLRYRFNYSLILFHFLLSEQESILAPLLVYGITTWYLNWIVIFLYLILFIEFFFIIPSFI